MKMINMYDSYPHIKYLQKERGYMYKVQVYIKPKNYVVWRGPKIAIEEGKKVAQQCYNIRDKKGNGCFLDWYTYDRFEWFKDNNIKFGK